MEFVTAIVLQSSGSFLFWNSYIFFRIFSSLHVSGERKCYEDAILSLGETAQEKNTGIIFAKQT